MKMGNTVPIFLLAACQATAGAQPANAPMASPREVLRAGQTVTGQPLAPLPDPYEIVVTRSELPAGGVLPMHRQPGPRYALVESGRIRVTYGEGRTIEAGPGDVIVEAVATWHEGSAVGDGPVRLLVIDHVPPGRVNIERR